MKDKKKELIDIIREGLQNAEHPPYREGAWEAYKAKFEPAPRYVRLRPVWAAAAVAALVGFTFLLWQPAMQPADSLSVAQQENPIGGLSDQQPSKGESGVDQRTEELGGLSGPGGSEHAAATEGLVVSERTAPVAGSSVNTSVSDNRQELRLDRMPTQRLQSLTDGATPRPLVRIAAADIQTFKPTHKATVVLSLDQDLIAGENIDPHFAYQSEVEQPLSPKKLRLNQRMELGAFLSPSTTDQSFDLGGGLVFAYQLNDKLALRTGASFNQYEVSMLNSDVQQVAVAKRQAAAPVQNSGKLISKAAAGLRTDNLFLPNLNAVTGKVQTLDIPLELRYNLSKQFYATGGVSYAAVLSQERFDHYEQSAAIPTYSSVSDSEKPTQNAVTTVKTTEASPDENINTNGFGGFVNFSIGRKVDLGKRMKVSVEPFVKLPVGQFKRADMNYTNGGVRIMTSF